MDKTIIIIGAGMAGLAAGCYARMNGFRTIIYEMGNRTGGLCTSWKMGNYTVNGSLHWLVGSGEGIGLHQIWQELGALEGKEIINHDIFYQYETHDGRRVSLYTDVNKLEDYLLEIAPYDHEVIRELTAAIRTMIKYDLPTDKPEELMGIVDGIKMFFTKFPLMRNILKWGNISIKEFANRFSEPLIKETLLNYWHPEMSMLAVVFTLAWMHKRTAGYPVGGSSAFIENIEKQYLALGGKIHYNSKVKTVLTIEDWVYGIELENGEKHVGDYVISAADGYSTIYKMLDKHLIPTDLKEKYNKLKLFPPVVMVSLGIDYDFYHIAHSANGLNFPLEYPFKVDDKHEVRRLTCQIYNYDKTLAPTGKTLVTTLIDSDFDYWKGLYADKELYNAAKDTIVSAVIHNLEHRFPMIRRKVEAYNVATPITYHNYTGNHRGSYEGWLPTPASFRLQVPKVLPKLHGFYMIGQWVEIGGGLPSAALSGKNVVQLICDAEKQTFQSYPAKMLYKLAKLADE